MDTENFFSLILPDEGRRCVATPSQSGGFRHYWCDTNAEAAARALALDAKGLNVYFGVASFGQEDNRKATNAHALKAFIADIDCGSGKPYATQKDGLHALIQFCSEVGLPRPHVISSGNGLHVYWPLDEAVDPTTWKEIATQLKHVMIHTGLKADPSRTADIASVLRVPGTHHRKAEPKLVKLILSGPITSQYDILTALITYANDHNVSAPSAPARVSGLNSDLAGGIEYAPKNAQYVADQCAVVGHMRDTRGLVDQPTWYGVLGVVAHCEDGDRLAHAWSNGHPEYTPEETDAKLAQVKGFGATSCAKLSECQPELCKACPHFGKITSPIVLGVTPPPQQLVVQDQSGADAKLQIPQGYRWTGSALEVHVKKQNSEGEDVADWMPFCDAFIYPTARINGGEGAWEMEVEMLVRAGEKRRFRIPTALIGGGGAELSKHLAGYEVVSRPKMDHHTQAYLRRWMDLQRVQADEVRTHSRFGWHEKNFLVGETLFTPNGPRPALVSGNAATKAGALGLKGDFDTWRGIVDRLYNHPEMEAFQFLVLTSFAAPIFSMMQQYGGVTVFAYSSETGVGKTTAECAGLSAWGNHAQMRLESHQSTVNAFMTYLGTYHSLPVIYDEMTTITDGQQVANTIFTISSGNAKERCDSAGNLRVNNSSWRTIVCASANNTVSEKLALFRANAEAEISRVFEFTVAPINKLTAPVAPDEAAIIVPKLLENYGHAGRMFAEYLVTNYDDVLGLIERTRSKINGYLTIKQSERYWSALHTSIFTALTICKQLDILDFDTVKLLSWVKTQINGNRGQVQQLVSGPSEQFGKMLTEIWQGVLVTSGEGDLRNNAEAVVLQHPRGTLVGRAIIPTKAGEHHVLYLSATHIRDWCSKNGVASIEIFKLGVKEGWIYPDIERVALGKGVDQYASVSAQVRAWAINSAQVAAAYNHIPMTKALRVLNGGQANAAAGSGRDPA